MQVFRKVVVKSAAGPDRALLEADTQVVDAFPRDLVECFVWWKAGWSTGDDRIRFVDDGCEGFGPSLEVEEGSLSVDEGLFYGGVLAVVISVRD